MNFSRITAIIVLRTVITIYEKNLPVFFTSDCPSDSDSKVKKMWKEYEKPTKKNSHSIYFETGKRKARI